MDDSTHYNLDLDNSAKLNTDLKKLISAYSITKNHEIRKALQVNFKKILEHVCINKEESDISHLNDYVREINSTLLELCLMFPDISNSHFKNVINELEKEVLAKKALEFEDLFTEEGRDLYRKITNSSVVISYLTQKINQPNQMLANFILILNNFLSKMVLVDKNEMIKLKIFLTGILAILSENTQSFNPLLFNQLEYLSQLLINNNLYTNEIDSFLNILNHSMRITKDNINFDILFHRIITNIRSIPPSTKIEEILKFFEENKILSLDKKNVGINFLKIKKKPLSSLEPEIDLSFLGDNFRNAGRDKEELTRAIKKKTRSTQKQAIRNLKKEAKIIDVQRQKVLGKIADRRKEDQKASNQFIEQQNIEYKKLVTSQTKKRLKFKKQRGKTK